MAKEEYYIDGPEVKQELFNSPRTTRVSWDQGAVVFNSAAIMKRGGESVTFNSKEEWTLQPDGNSLKVVATSPGFRGGETKTILIFEKR